MSQKLCKAILESKSESSSKRTNLVLGRNIGAEKISTNGTKVIIGMGRKGPR
jgi:hypothetical protein